MFGDRKIKVEENVVCNFCLSDNRNLIALGKYSTTFSNIMQEKYTVLAKMNLLSTIICWECSAVLEKVVQFQNKVTRAQQKLKLMETGNNDYKSLSSLKRVVISEENHYHYEYHEKSNIINYNIQNIINDVKVDEIYDSIEIKIGEEIIDDKNIDLHEYNDVGNEIYDNDLYSQIEEQVNSNIKIESDLIVKKSKPTQNNYKLQCTVLEGVPYEPKNFPIIYINNEELFEQRNKLKNELKYKNSAFKCESCIRRFSTKKKLGLHLEKYHSKTKGNIICDICARRFSDKKNLGLHLRSHYKWRLCKLCGTLLARENQAYHYQRDHMYLYKCLECDRTLFNIQTFRDHYKDYHSTFICHDCGIKYKSKMELIKHIAKRHLPKTTYCDICKKNFKTSRHLNAHCSLHHKVAESPSYCVECDLTFLNQSLYKRHLTTSVKHKKPMKRSFPCPICNKVYARPTSMSYHFDFVHKQQSKFICNVCNRFFLNGFRLRQHVASTHDKVPAIKNKMCRICGRGFSTNRILENHIRTHTGERPNLCPHCPATFAQRTAMVIHVRNIHTKKNILI